MVEKLEPDLLVVVMNLPPSLLPLPMCLPLSLVHKLGSWALDLDLCPEWDLQ